MADLLATTAATVLNLPEGEVTDDLAFNSVKNWDSMNHINFMLALEEAFEISIPDDDIVELTSIDAIRRYLATRGLATNNVFGS